MMENFTTGLEIYVFRKIQTLIKHKPLNLFQIQYKTFLSVSAYL